jgi:hypothetical protein
MLMQKSKHAKRRMIMQLLESNNVKRETDVTLKRINCNTLKFAYLENRTKII